MTHRASPRFWQHYNALREDLQQQADSAYDLLKADPRHPSLQLKKIGRFWSVRIGLRYRALAVEENTNLVWFWIGHHSEYDRLLGQQ
ncbi:MAG TPA: hypothetical protein VM008_01820 [Phycisphaerae bacterium]|nr:hypothetical protein [Phycisphaerae bacterium]